MYITLNSATESNDANFTNYLNEPLIIEPNSYICLNGAGFQTHDNSYDLGRIESFQFRLSFQYVGVTTLFTFPAGDYTLQSFCDTWNALVIDESPYYIFFLDPEDNATNPLFVQVQMYRKQPPGTDQDRDFWTETYLGNDKTARMASLRGQDPAIVADEEVVALGDNSASTSADRILYIGGTDANNNDFVCSATAPANRVGTNPLLTWYREPETTQTRYSYEMNRLTDKAICWSMADGGRYGSFFLDALQTNYDEATTYMDTIDQARLNNFYIMKIDCPVSGIATLTMRKTDGTLHTFPTRPFNPGDVFCTSAVPGLRAAPNQGNYDMKVEHMKNSLNMIGWIPLDPSFATQDEGVIDSNVLLQDQVAWQAHYPCSTNEYKLYETGNYMMGIRLGNASDLNDKYGVADASSRQLVTNVTCSATTPVAERRWTTALAELPGLETIMPNKNATFLQRFSRTGTNHQMNQCVELGNGNLDTGIESALPTAFTICFRLVDDAGIGGGSATHVILGGVVGAPASADILKVIIGSASTTLYDYNGGNVSITPLLNGTGAAFPGWAYDTSYCVTLGNGGTGTQIVSIQVSLDDGTFYAASAASSGANGRFPNLSYVGAQYGPDVNPVNTTTRMNGLVWDLRISQQNLGETLPVHYDEWEEIHKTIAQFSLLTANAGVVKSSEWYYNFNTRIAWNTPRQNEGNEIVYIDRIYPNMRVSPIFQKTDGVASVQKNWFHMGNLTAIPHVTTSATKLLESGDLQEAQSWIGNQAFGMVTDGVNAITNPLVKDIASTIPSLELITKRTNSVGVETFAADYIDWYDHFDIITPFATMDGDTVANGVDVREQVYNINIENLPHRTINGRTNNISKSIYEILHNETQNTIKGDTELINFVPRHKIWIPLKNAGQMIVNNLHVKITDAAMKEVKDLVGDTHIHIEITPREEIIS